MEEEKLGFNTKAIHVGNSPDEETGAVTSPIHFSSTFKQDEVGVHKGYDYSRAGNPTRERFEKNISSLEDASHGIAFSSGMAAITALFQTMSHGDHVILGRNVYGGTYRMVTQVLSNHGFEFDFVDTRSLNKVESMIKTNTKWIFAETPTNPLLELCDIEALSMLSKSRGLKLVIDNNKLQLLAYSASKGSAIEELDVDFIHDKLEIGFNSRYLLDIITEIDGNEVTLNFSDPAAPVLIVDDAEDNLFFVLMPMRI